MLIIRTSASRPDLLKESTKSIYENLKSSEEHKMIIHEDVLNKEKSNECIHFIKYLPNCEYSIDDPAKGHTASFYWLVNQIPKNTKYFMFWEDDYTLDKEVDLDKLISLMDKYRQINQICFPKRNILSQKANFVKKPVIFDDVKLTVSNHWYVAPAVWRYSFIMPYIERMIKKHPLLKDGSGGWGWHWAINRILKGMNELGEQKADEIQEKYGHYYLGWPEKGSKLITHIGTPDRSIRNGYMP